jgi:T5SS/PEP-CTERM-associated repeat protein
MRQKAHLRFAVLHLLVCLAVLLSVPAEAQTLYVTNTTNISASQSYSNAFIGNSNNLGSLVGELTIDSGAVLTVTNDFLMGNGLNSFSNSVLLTGTDSELNAGRISVGEFSSGNSMVVTNGARLLTEIGGAATESIVVGFGGVTSNNILTIAGSGTTWVQTTNNRTINIGDNGDNNQLVVRDGAVASFGGNILVGRVNVATGNSMLVTGAGTILTNRSILLGGGNDQSLVISDGAQVVSTNTGSSSINPSFTLGNTFGANATGHSATVTGVGTTYIMAGGANIGLYGVGSMVVSNGAQVFNSNNVTIGSGASANGSSALVTGSGSVWSNSRTFAVGAGANTNSSMTVRDGAVVHSGNGTEIGANTNSTGASVTIDGATWNQNAQVFRAGYLGSENRVLITNGGVLNLSNNVLIVGQGQSDVNGAHSNVMTVTGPNSSINQVALPSASGNNFGFRGRDNSFVISNGATAVMGGTTASNGMNQIGWDTNSSGNSLVVTDAGSFFGGRGDLEIGVRGSSNFASVLNGGLFTNGTVRIGASNSATGNYLLVDGAGSVFSNRISITVGNGTNTDNRVNVTNGGVLHAGGLLNVHSNNRVNAAGSVWVGQDRPSVQTVNVLHTNANSNSVLTVNGLVAAEGTVTVGTRGVLGGAGIVQATETIIASGGTVSPGNSPGNLVVDGDLTWLGGGNYNWQIHDATGLAGTGWDYMPVIGALDLTALSSDSRFNINLWSLSAVSPDANGAAINFDNTLDGQSWNILFAIGGITGFDASDFNINIGSTNGTGGLANALAPGGFFGIEQNGNALSLTYTVPEPSTYALIALAGAGAAFMRWRRRS